jgi:polyhydroxybutyrate depolymerase
MYRYWLAAVFSLVALSCRPAPCEGTTGICTGFEKLSVGGNERTYRVHLPPAYDGKTLLPVILLLHGRLGTPENSEELTHMDSIADKHRFIVISPEGFKRSWNDPRGVTPASEKKIDDDAFLTALIDSLPKKYAVDPKRIYAAGISNGAFMTTHLGCIASDKLAGIATIIGAFSENSLASCKPTRSLPVMLIMGDDDPLVPYQGGPTRKDGQGVVISAQKSREAWAEKDGCEVTPTTINEPDTNPNDHTKTRRETHSACKDGAQVVMLTVEGGGHTWPGGKQYLKEAKIGFTSRDFDASETILSFFELFSLPSTEIK